MLVAWTRAMLLQFAHPLVAAGVHEHSTFRSGRLASVTRLHHTVKAMLTLTYGDERERERVLEAIRAIHRRVHGCLRHDVGHYPAGARYSAEDPALVRWVHLTLMESIPLAYDHLIRPIGEAERDAFCRDAASVAIALGASAANTPSTWAAITAAVDETRRSGAIVVGPEALELARAVLWPRLTPVAAPAAWINRLIAVGLLPRDIREQYGLEWSPRHQRRFEAVAASLRTMRRLAPDAVALWPEARRAARSQPPR